MVTNPPANAGDMSLIPGLGRSPGEGNGYLLQYSCLENPMDRGAQQAIVHGVARVGHNLVTKPPPPPCSKLCYALNLCCPIYQTLTAACKLKIQFLSFPGYISSAQ